MTVKTYSMKRDMVDFDNLTEKQQKVVGIINNAMLGVTSHDEMDDLVERKMKEAKEIRKNIKPLNKEELQAVVAFMTVYASQHHSDKNPIHLYELFKREEYEFKGVYAPLNNVKTEQFAKFIFDGISRSINEKERLELLDGDFVVFSNGETEGYFQVEAYDGSLVLFSEKTGAFIANTDYVVRKVVDSDEELIASIVVNYKEGATIHLYDDQLENYASFKPVNTQGEKILLLDVKSNMIVENIYDSIEEIAKVLITDNVETVEVL